MNDQAGTVVSPDQFVPTPPRPPRRTRLIPWIQIATALVAVAAGVILWFLFTAKAVQFDVNVDDAEVTVTGGLVFESADSFLMRPGTYEAHATATGHYDLTQEIVVTADDDPTFVLTLQRLPGDVQFSSSPAGAEVSLEGQTIGTTPLFSQIPAGVATLDFRAPRYIDGELTVDIVGMEEPQSVHLDLAPDWATLTVPTTPEGAVVYIDDQDSGFRTPGPVEIMSGEHTISVKKPGYARWTDIVYVTAGEVRTMEPIVLEPVGGALMVQSKPPGANVSVDKRFAGTTPVTLDLEPGRSHDVEVLLVGYELETRRVTVRSEEEKVLDLELREAVGNLKVITEPEGVEIWIDGEMKGLSNDTLALQAVEHDVELRKEGYAGYRNHLTIQPGFTQSLRVHLLTLEEARLEALRQVRTTADGQEIVLLDPGPIRMGASRRQPGRRANEPYRTANLNRLYYIGKHEVTNAQFAQFAPGHDSGDYQGHALNKEDQPVVNVSWNEAAFFCNALSDQEGLEPFYLVEGAKVVGFNPSSLGYRLPTEAEWSWAARHVEGQEELLHFAWGENLPPPDRFGNYADRSAQFIVSRVLFGFNDNHTVSAPVGTFGANTKGLFDIGGNVAEWMHDFYSIPQAETTIDVMGPTDGEYRVIRGSSYLHGAITDVRMSFRDYGTEGRHDVGFRIARFAE